MRAAVYAGTRNLYPHMVTAAKSLVCNSNVEKVYFLTEDNEFPERLPGIVQTVNVSGQKWFGENCANRKTPFTYMSLMRVCYTKLFTQLDRILQLDVDTVVVDDISGLWDLDMKGKWFAAVEDHGWYKPFGPKYYNMGTAMFNLLQIRCDCIDDTLIEYLNTTGTKFVDEEAWNKFGVWKDIGLPNRFNECGATGYTDNPAIVHFAGIKDWMNHPNVPRLEYLRKYREMMWEEALNGNRTHRRTHV